MPEQKVTVVIDPKTGEMEFEVEGVAGIKCTEITDALVASHEQVDQQFTHEYEVPDTLPDYIHDPVGE
jgi:hypothetical protein